MVQTDCLHFSGSRPCGQKGPCDQDCEAFKKIDHYLMVVHLEALGAVLRGTSILRALKRKYPSSHITWVTQSPAHYLLENNPLIDRVLTTCANDLLELSTRQFDAAFVLDKSLKAVGVVKGTQCNQLFGFTADPRSGAIIPATPAAEELWRIGLSDELKFFVNRKPETQLLLESLELGPYRRDPYILQLTQEELSLSQARRKEWSSSGKIVVGLNTGCSSTIPYKKMSIESHRNLLRFFQTRRDLSLVLLGGPEDSERNQAIAKDLRVFQSPTCLGLRDGFASVDACDIIVTGDSLGMHMGIALEKWVVAWFGPTCAHEIDFYGRGSVVFASTTCGPCWRRSCQNQEMCYDHVPINQLVDGVKKGIAWHRSSIIQPFSETYFSPSP